MIAEEQSGRPEWMACTANTPGNKMCMNPSCEAHPFVCSRADCCCQDAHRDHEQEDLEQLLKKVPIPEPSKDEAAVKEFLQTVQREVRQLRERHQQIIKKRKADTSKYAEMRRKLVSGEPLTAEELTGKSFAGMLKEMELIKTPYKLSGDKLKEEIPNIKAKYQAFLTEVEELWKGEQSPKQPPSS